MIPVYMQVFLLFRAIAGNEQTNPIGAEETHISSTYLWDKLNFPALWQVYIRVMAFDLMQSSMYLHSDSASNYSTQNTLVDVSRNLPIIFRTKYPCRWGKHFVSGRQINGQFFTYTQYLVYYFPLAVTRICGIFNITYTPSHFQDEAPIAKPLSPGYQPYGVSWQLHAGNPFGINLTLVEFSAPQSHGCGDARIQIKVFYYEQWFPFKVCPNWGKHNFVGSFVQVTYRMEYYQKPALMDTNDQHFTKLSFQYQIVNYKDMSLRLYMVPMVPRRQLVQLGVQYRLSTPSSNDTRLDNSALVYVGKVPNAIIYSFTLYTANFLTPVIMRKNIACNIPEAEVIFYDGPVQSFWQPALPILKHWTFSQISNHTTGNADEDVRGSIGELNIIFLAPQSDTHKTAYMAIIWHAKPMMPSLFRYDMLVLDLKKESRINLRTQRRKTFFEVVHIRAPKGKFVHLGFQDITYALHTDAYPNRYLEHCIDGFEMRNPTDAVIGNICSNLTAEQFRKHYQADGLTVQREVTLLKKQYAWLAHISAVIIASVHNCSGHINVLPRLHDMHSTVWSPSGTLSFEPGENFYFVNRTYGFHVENLNFKIIFRRSPKACWKLQLVPFEEMKNVILRLGKSFFLDVMYIITNEDLTSPSHFVMRFSSIGDTVRFHNISSLYGLRIHFVTTRFGKFASSFMGVWATEAYSAQIGMHLTWLTHIAGFAVQVEEGTGAMVCTYERGGKPPDIFYVLYHLHLLGPCANVERNVKEIHMLSIYKTHTDRRCCQYDGVIITDDPVQAYVLLYLRYQGSVSSTGHEWGVFGSGDTINFHVLCSRLCTSLIIRILALNASHSNPISLRYDANLIEDNDIGVALSVPSSSFGLVKPSLPVLAWTRVCADVHCYIAPRGKQVATWDEAREACNKENTTLASINSDLEWTLFTQLLQQTREKSISNISSSMLFYIGLVTDVNHSTHYSTPVWIDGSPYAFQNWYRPSGQTVYPKHFHDFSLLNWLRHLIGKDLLAHKNVSFFEPDTIQPRSVKDKLCAAVLVRPTLLPQWIVIPCNEAIPYASFICESKINSNRSILENKARFTVRAHTECPKETINLESSCLYVVNYISRNGYNMKDTCTRLGLSAFFLPSFLFYPDPHLSWIKWNPYDIFFINLLVSMTHRWYPIFGQDSGNRDVIVGARPRQSSHPDMVGLQYSHNNLMHLRITDIDNQLLSTRVHVVLCNQSMHVTNSACLDGHAMCDDGTCILSHYVCDGRVDCPDASDEFDCKHVCSFLNAFNGDSNCFISCISPQCVCNNLYFPCTWGGCIPWSRVCNAVPDCPNGEDEQICFFVTSNSEHRFIERELSDKPSYISTHSDYLYQCANGPNISRVLVDDLVPDCPEQDDEEQYHSFLNNGSSTMFFPDEILCKEPNATPCTKNYKNVCYPRHLYCIYDVILPPQTNMPSSETETCRNGAHLKYCAMYSCPSFFKCPSAYCIPVHAICNGKVDCPNGEDEENCKNISCPGFLLCRYDNVCVHSQDVWSGRVKCPLSMDDKALHGRGPCPEQCECLGNAMMCTSPVKLKLPKLSESLRIMLISNTELALDDLRWKVDRVALLQLEFTFCNISTIKWEHFVPLTFLQRLILRNNVIPFLPNGIFQSLSVVKEVDLGHNLISKINPGIFEGMGEVHIIKLDFNKLTFIAPCTFGHLKNLAVLDLSNNYLKILGDNVFCRSSKSSLKQLSFGGNHIQSIDNTVLETDMSNLVHLNTTPLKICCFLPSVDHCYPEDKFYFSTCRNLLGVAFRYGAFVSGLSVFFISMFSVSWSLRKVSVGLKNKATSGNRNLNSILNLILFICHGLQSIHAIILACVDIVFHDYYSLYEEVWKKHPLCLMLNISLYTLLLVSVFLTLLVSYMRMIACVYPFSLVMITASQLICAIIICLCISLSVSYLPHSGLVGSSVDKSHMTLGLSIVLPIIDHDQLLWSLMCYVLPLSVMIITSSAFQIACIRALLQKAGQLKEFSTNIPQRRGSVARCAAALVLPVCLQMPLLFLHVAAMTGTVIPPQISVAATMFTLHGYGIINAILYIVITPDFISFICAMYSPHLTMS